MNLTEERERKGLNLSFRESQIVLKTQIETLKLKLMERDNELKSLWEIILVAEGGQHSR